MLQTSVAVSDVKCSTDPQSRDVRTLDRGSKWPNCQTTVVPHYDKVLVDSQAASIGACHFSSKQRPSPLQRSFLDTQAQSSEETKLPIYIMEWKLTVNKRVAAKHTENDLVLAPSDVWNEEISSTIATS